MDLLRRGTFLRIFLFLLLMTVLLLGVPLLSTHVQADTISKKSLTLTVGKTYTLKVKKPDETVVSNTKIVWSSSNKRVATVSSKGKVTARKCGTAKITAKVGKKKYTCTIRVNCAHMYDKIEVFPTCEANGAVGYQCALCGYSYVDHMVEPKGHAESDWLVYTRATTEQSGIRFRTCISCGELMEVEEVPRVETPCTWTLASFEDQSGSQGMFYSLYNEDDGTLILVDGGNLGNTQLVRDVIKAYGGTVHAWFLTHYHRDHVDAFNQIYADPQGIVIEKIYDSPMDAAYYAEHAKEWDDLESFQTYMTLTAGDERLTHLSPGDSFTIDSLQIDIFHAWYEGIEKKNYGDLPNNAGLVFKVSGDADSILFCSDVNNEAVMYDLMTTYWDRMKAEFMQLGHHGNNSVPYYIYNYLDPKKAIFDSPGWLMESDTYKAKALKEYLTQKGVECYDFSSAVNVFSFR